MNLKNSFYVLHFSGLATMRHIPPQMSVEVLTMLQSTNTWAVCVKARLHQISMLSPAPGSEDYLLPCARP